VSYVPPTAADVLAYLGAGTTATVDEIGPVLLAEIELQGSFVRFPVQDDPDVAEPYPASLAEALKRRVARALAARGIPLGIIPSMGDAGGTSYLSAFDSETRRLEARYRRRPVG
jgi:hypothetical protein